MIILGITGCTKHDAQKPDEFLTDIQEESASEITDAHEQISENNNTDEHLFTKWKSKIVYANWSNDKVINANASNRDNLVFGGHHPVYLIDSYSALENFKSTYDNILTFDKGCDEIPSFTEATTINNEKFFEANSLIIVYMTANNSSLRFDVDKIL